MLRFSVTIIRLVALPETMGDPFIALEYLAKTQKEIVSAVGGIEQEIDVHKIISRNPNLLDTGIRTTGYMMMVA